MIKNATVWLSTQVTVSVPERLMMMITSAKQTGDTVEILVYGLQTKQAGMPPVRNCPGPITVDLCDISTAIITGLKL